MTIKKSNLFKHIEEFLNKCISCGKKLQLIIEPYGKEPSAPAVVINRCKKCKKELDKVFPSTYTEYSNMIAQGSRKPRHE